MKISIIMPVYNGATFVSQGVSSIMNQPFKDWELIIINDGSTDDTETICKQLAKCDTRIRFFSLQNNGAGAARNYGLKVAVGDWIMFLDADDLYLENSINENLIRKLEEYSRRNTDLILTASCESDLMLKVPIKYYSVVDDYRIIPSKEFWTGIYRRTFLIENNIYFFEYKEQDIETAFRYRMISKTDHIVFDNEICFYLQRINVWSNTHTWNRFVLHSVKAKVYIELLRECRNAEHARWIYDVILKELYQFYKSFLFSDCPDRNILNATNREYKYVVKGALKKEVEQTRGYKIPKTNFLRGHLHITKKQKYIMRLLYIYANLKKKRVDFSREVESKEEKRPEIDSMIISKRLKYISLYINHVICK